MKRKFLIIDGRELGHSELFEQNKGEVRYVPSFSDSFMKRLDQPVTRPKEVSNLPLCNDILIDIFERLYLRYLYNADYGALSHLLFTSKFFVVEFYKKFVDAHPKDLSVFDICIRVSSLLESLEHTIELLIDQPRIPSHRQHYMVRLGGEQQCGEVVDWNSKTNWPWLKPILTICRAGTDIMNDDGTSLGGIKEYYMGDGTLDMTWFMGASVGNGLFQASYYRTPVLIFETNNIMGLRDLSVHGSVSLGTWMYLLKYCLGPDCGFFLYRTGFHNRSALAEVYPERYEGRHELVELCE